MTPIPVPPPARILPPTTAYATGLVCELRPDLADAVRAAVLGDDALDDLEAMAVAHLVRGEEHAMRVLSRLGEIVDHPDDVRVTLPRLADVVFDSFQWCSPTANFSDLALSAMYLHFGFDPCWEHAKTPNDLRCLRRLIDLHAHTISPDADVRAAWAKAHLDALETP